MNTKDLMIGNWVYFTRKSKFPMQVVSIGDNYVYLDFEGNEGDVFEPTLEEVQPIEVTEEILQNSGFEKYEEFSPVGETRTKEPYFILSAEGYDFFFKKTYKNNDTYWCLNVSDNYLLTRSTFYIKYVHEIQNILRLITKKDLVVKL